eukprot:349627-Chlamydomonas_euryale.AAC.11
MRCHVPDMRLCESSHITSSAEEGGTCAMLSLHITPHLWHASGTPLARLWHASGTPLARLWHASGTPLARLWHASGTPLGQGVLLIQGQA